MTAADRPTRERLIDETERWFQRRGLPGAQVDDVTVFDLFNRIIPVLVLVLVAEAISLALRDRYRGPALVGVFALAVAGLVLLLVMVRRRRPRRRWRLPRPLTALVAVAFVVGPPVVAATFDDSTRMVGWLLGINVIVLVVATLMEYYNVPPVIRHELKEIRTGQRKMLAPLRQVLPILLLVVLFLFMTAEVWQVAHDATPLGFVVVVAALIGFAAAFVAARAEDALDGVSQFATWEEVHDVARSTSAPDLPLTGPLPEPPDLRDDAIGRGEVSLLLWVTMTVQLLVVTVVVSVALTVIGALVVRRQTIVQWTELEDVDWDPLVAVSLAGNEYPVAVETVLMATLLGVFSALQFAVSIMTDTAMQAAYFTGIRRDAREVLAVRARYHRFLDEDVVTGHSEPDEDP